MRSIICVLMSLVLAAAVCMAQDLDTVSFVDQFDSGQRGGNGDEGRAGTGNGDWSHQLLTAGTAGLSGADVNYMNTFAAEYSQGPGEIESPVYDVTSASNINPDRAWTIPAYPANTRPGATSPNYAVLVGDDGGYNTLSFGEWDDRNYDVKVDVYLRADTALNGANNEFVRYGLAARIQQGTDPDGIIDPWEEITVEGPGWIIRQRGCYALLYDSSEGNVYACKVFQQLLSPNPWDDIRDLSLINKDNATVPVLEFLGSPVAVSEGWHTLGIRCSGQSLTFTVDATSFEVNDWLWSTGPACLFYRTNSTIVNTQTYDHGGYFDQLRSDPAPVPPPAAAHSWQLYK